MAAVALITGASGLIGQHVLRAMGRRGLGADAVDHQRDDLLAPGVPTALVERVQPAVVVHLAWVASGTPGYRDSPDNERWLRASLELARPAAPPGAAARHRHLARHVIGRRTMRTRRPSGALAAH